MKNKPVIIDSPKAEKCNPKIFGKLCGMKTISHQAKDFDDFFERNLTNESEIDPKIISRIEDYVNRYPHNNEKIEIYEKYSIIEDFCIILIKVKCLPKEHFLPYRSESSIRSRYCKKLRYLTNKNFKEILKHLDENGVENKTLSFLKKEFQGIIEGNNKIILLDSEESKQKEEENSFHSNEKIEILNQINEKQSSITNNDVKQSPESFEEKSQENQSQRSDSHEKPVSKEMEIEKSDDNVDIEQEEQNNESFFKIFYKTLGLLINVDQNKLLPCLISKEKESYSGLIKKENISIMRNFNTNKREILNAPSEALQILLKLEQKFNKSSSVLLQDLYKVSGNINDLIEFYEDPEKMDYITWNNDEDQILEKAISPNDNSFKLLLRYKGAERVKSRIKFKHFKKNFEI